VDEDEATVADRFFFIRCLEGIEQGQRVSKYVLHGAADGGWKELMQGETIGACKLDRIASSSLRRLRVTVLDAIAPPLPLRIAAYRAGGD